jgi:hypothetical protein
MHIHEMNVQHPYPVATTKHGTGVVWVVHVLQHHREIGLATSEH